LAAPYWRFAPIRVFPGLFERLSGAYFKSMMTNPRVFILAPNKNQSGTIFK
jgi:hypothetical protein